ncbi:MAG: DUF4258 domain-containing protein [Deltaproteobacteria bacterium]|nr:DUF4258 domain-containing protein [Deltaproteobacteria bacterium]
MQYKISRYAREELVRRRIALAVLEDILQQPQQVLPQGNDKKVYQSQVVMEAGEIFLVRVIVSENTDPPTVVTVYRTKKIKKYWRMT